MTKIYKFQGDIDSDALQKLQKVKETQSNKVKQN